MHNYSIANADTVLPRNTYYPNVAPVSESKVLTWNT